MERGRGSGRAAWLALTLTALGLATAPVRNTFSRRIERQADDFVLALTENVPAFVGAIERLAALNLADRRPSRLEEMLLYTHPSIDRRLVRHAPASPGARAGAPASSPVDGSASRPGG